MRLSNITIHDGTFIIVSLLIFLLNGCVVDTTEETPHERNAVKLGSSHVIAEFEFFRNVPYGTPKPSYSEEGVRWLNDNEFCAATSKIFSEYSHGKGDGLNIIQLTREGNIFYGDIPMECIQQMGVFCQKNNRGEIVGSVQFPISQNDTTFLLIQMTDDCEIVGLECHNSFHINGLDLRLIQEIFTQALDYDCPHCWASYMNPTLYENSWQDVRTIEMDSIWPRFLESSIYRCKTRVEDHFSFRGMGIPQKAESWVMNDLKIAFAVDEILPYVHRAKVALGRKVADPPMEAYSFLDSINYSPDLFLMTPTDLPQRKILEGILKIPGSGIEEIGETPVAKWQKEVKQILAPAIKEPTKLLMDLLAGMSYVLQIDKGIPLSEEQISNINKGFTDDIGKIVLSYNTDLARRAQEN